MPLIRVDDITPGVTIRVRRGRRGREVTVANKFTGPSTTIHDPAVMLGQAIMDSLDPVKAPGRVRVFSRDEIAAMNKQRAGK